MPGWFEGGLNRLLRRLRTALRIGPKDAGAAMARWWPQAVLPGSPSIGPSVAWKAITAQIVSQGWLHPAGAWALARGHVDLAMELATRALAARHDAATLRQACRIAYEAARLKEAAEWANALEAASPPGEGDRRLISAIRERCAVMARLGNPPGVAACEPIPGRVLALLAYRLPYTSNGYATRSHGLLTALRERGWEVMPYSRPGYPEDAGHSVGGELPLRDRVGGLDYGRMPRSTRRTLGHMPYLLAAADEVGQFVAELRPAVVHAASNYMTALPACIAAHEAGLPFVYEVRGFWDVTRVSSNPDFAFTTEYRYLRHFESELLRQADAVVTLTQAMRNELIRRGAPADRIEVAPNGVDVQTLQPRPRSAELARRIGLPADRPVIGYAGSFVDYEGLDDLVLACAQLRRTGRTFHLLLVGDGLHEEAIRRAIDENGIADQVSLPGRVAHEDVPDYYALMDVCAFPRKAWPVCELVSPLKPFEAMALGKPIVVSSVAAMAEVIDEGVNGRVFAKGSVQELAKALERLLDDLPEARAMGHRARQWVEARRGWHASAEAVERAYAAAAAHRAAG
ncbi:glycosyltransferase family 4 protein [Ideonella sp. YS5]|uniref:glycosyltransferase family 4 protein n=1 Tax=Ideonella sp. YS5 TaxID=3453714 RepID=UPI003EEEADA1